MSVGKRALSEALRGLQPYLESLLNFVYPPFCVLCRTRLPSSANPVCEECWLALPRIADGDVQNNLANEVATKSLDMCLSVWHFSDQLQVLIHELKYLKMRSLAHSLGNEMARLASAVADYRHANLVIPVPLHKTKLRERGFNQSFLLAECVAQALGIPVATDVLGRKRHTHSQAKLGSVERAQNVLGAFAVTEKDLVRNRTVILVDDVVTTGATLGACANCLQETDVKKVLGLTAARTD